MQVLPPPSFVPYHVNMPVYGVSSLYQGLSSQIFSNQMANNNWAAGMSSRRFEAERIDNLERKIDFLIESQQSSRRRYQ